jgi:hypothetical protein
MPQKHLPGFLKKYSLTQIFWGFLCIHVFLWTAIPTLVCPNVPLDVIEGYAWGREWLIGTYKHPPMQAWWLEILAQITGRAMWAHFFASQLAIGIAFWGVWETGKRILEPLPALLAVMLLEGIVYYNFTSIEFNPNILQLPFWALIGLFYYRGIKDNTIADWMLLGVFSAGGVYTKYSTVLLLVVLAILTILRPEGRRRLKSVGPYLAVLTAFVLFLPHLQWLFNNDFLPYTYAETRMRHPTPPGIIRSAIIIPAAFLISQLLAMLPAILVLIAFSGGRTQITKNDIRGFDRAFLTAMTFGPCVLVFLMALVLGYKVHDMWGTPFWNFIGLWTLAYFQPAMTTQTVWRFMASLTVVFCATLMIYGGSVVVYPYATDKVLRVHFPGKDLAREITVGWKNATPMPLRYVIGDTWPAGNVAYFSKDQPHVFISRDFSISPWVTPEDIKRDGAVFVWCIQYCSNGNYVNNWKDIQGMPEFMQQHPNAKIQESLTLKKKTEAKVPSAVIGWAILPPESH